MTTEQALAAYVHDPTPETLAPVRDLVRRSANYRTDLVPGQVLGALLRHGDHAGALAAGRAMMPGALLSPTVHLLLARAHEAAGDPSAADREVAIARAAVAGILGTGDGSAEAPWRILRLSDEYDVLRALGTASTGQQLLTRGGRDLDRHDAADGASYHFDVTGML